MFGLETLDVLIGLVTIYLAFAVACTAVVEAISATLKLRASNLERAMGELLQGGFKDNKQLVEAFYEHPLIESLSEGAKGRPSYLNSDLVARVVQSIVTAPEKFDDALEGFNRLKVAVEELPEKVTLPADRTGFLATARRALGLSEPSPAGERTVDNRVKKLLQELIVEAAQRGGDLEAGFRTAVSAHFDRTVERASGWFRRRVQMWTFLVAFALVFANNVDTVEITTALSADPAARAALVKAAAEVESRGPPASAAAPASASGESNPGKPDAPAAGVQPAGDVGDSAGDGAGNGSQEPEETDPLLAKAGEQWQDAMTRIAEATALIPLGWDESVSDLGVGGWLAKFFGLLVSVFAVSLGAPWWFSVLQHLNAVRSTGRAIVTGDADDKGDKSE